MEAARPNVDDDSDDNEEVSARDVRNPKILGSVISPSNPGGRAICFPRGGHCYECRLE